MYSHFTWSEAGGERCDVLRSFEPVQPFVLFELARTAGCSAFLDIGANVGIYSLFFTRLPGIRKILAFEPTPGTFEELEASFRLNPTEEIIPIPMRCAVSNTDESVEFGVFADLSGINAVVGTHSDDRGAFARTITVPSMQLDSLAEELRGTRPCLKIDVEGHELAVLEGARQVLTENPCVVQIENFGEKNLPVEFLADGLGYRRVFAIGPDTYMSNSDELADATRTLDAVERACSAVVACEAERRQDAGTRRTSTIRRRIGGLSIEIDGRLAGALKKVRGEMRLPGPRAVKG